MDESPSTHDQECPALPASPEALAPTSPPGPDLREPNCHDGRTPGVSWCGHEVPPRRRDRNHVAWRSRRSAPRRATTDPHPIRNGARRRSNIEVVSSARTTLPPSRRTSMFYRETLESRTPLAPDTGGPKPTFAKSARRPAARRRVIELPDLEATDWARLKVRPRFASNHEVMSPSPRSASRVPNEPRTC